jgi:hypothetical protein
LIRAYIKHITKVEFFIAFKKAYLQLITVENAQVGFHGAGLVPFDPRAVLLKLDVKLRTPTPTGPPSLDADPWVSQTPHNPTGALSQTTLVKNRIVRHQGSSPTTVFATVKALAKGTERLAHEVTLLTAKNRTLRKANEALSKRRRAKKNRIRQGGVLTIEDAHDILAQEEVDAQIRRDRRSGEDFRNEGRSTVQRYGTCRKPGHNVQTCPKIVKTSSSLDSE